MAVPFNLTLQLDSNNYCPTVVQTQVGEDVQFNIQILENSIVKTSYTSTTIEFCAIVKDINGTKHKLEITSGLSAGTDGTIKISPSNLTAVAGIGTGEVYLKDSDGKYAISNPFRIAVRGTNKDDVGQALEDTATTYDELVEILEAYNDGELGGMTTEQATQLATNTSNIASLTSQLAALTSVSSANINDTTPSTSTTYSSSKIEDLVDSIEGGSGVTSYNDLTDKPTIPSKTSQLQNDSGYAKESNLANVATSGSYDDLNGKPTIIQIDDTTSNTLKTYSSSKIESLIASAGQAPTGTAGNPIPVTSISEMTDTTKYYYLVSNNHIYKYEQVSTSTTTWTDTGNIYTKPTPTGAQTDPIPVASVDNMTDTSKYYYLTSNNHIYKCVTTTTPATTTPNFVNQISISTDTDGSIYNGTGYKENSRLGSSGGVYNNYTGAHTTGFIPIEIGDVLRFKNLVIRSDDANNGVMNIVFYKSDKSRLYNGYWDGIISNQQGVCDSDGNLTQMTITVVGGITSAAKFIRFTFKGDNPSTSIITNNEEITYTTTPESSTSEWQDTGNTYTAPTPTGTISDPIPAASVNDMIVISKYYYLTSNNHIYHCDSTSSTTYAWTDTGITYDNTTSAVINDSSVTPEKTTFITKDATNNTYTMSDDIGLQPSVRTELNNLKTTTGNVYSSIPSAIKTLLDTYISTVRDMNGDFVMPLITDIHSIYNEPYEIFRYVADSGIADVAFNLGDNIIDHEGTRAAALAYLDNDFAINNSPINKKCEIYTLRGNHDNNPEANNTLSVMIPDDVFYSHSELRTKSCHGVSNKNYGYVDFEKPKIRVIFLDSGDIYNETTGEPLTTAYNIMLQSKQFTWFCTKALDFSDKKDKSEWGMITLTHGRLGNLSSGFAPVLQAFKNGTTASGTGRCTISSTVYADMTYNVDFTSQGAMKYLCSVCGHLHSDKMELFGSTGTYEVLIANDNGTAYYYDSEGTKQTYTRSGDAQKHLFDTLVYNKATNKITFKRFGLGSDRVINLSTT